ncbi:MAG: class I SAM-dependent methyltransferase [Spirochaetes bacterium]|nr:class I SAM-dependent methyltransferase [Spirochaetota bacterium]
MRLKSCPVCGGALNNLENYDFLQCRLCGTVFNSAHLIIEYSDTYFTSDYKSQYGKTYEEDYPAIRRFCDRRIERIKKILSHAGFNSVMDVASALGFFLKAAHDNGAADCTGVEISKYACDYMKKNYPFSVRNESFDNFQTEKKYDVVTAWYFIEHSPDIVQTVQKLSSFVKEGGVLAFSVPSAFSPLFSFNRKKFFDTHPVDHSADLTPKGIRILLKQNGFRKIKVYPAAYHPERIMSKECFFFPFFSFFFKKYADFTAFSDTIEVYAVK